MHMYMYTHNYKHTCTCTCIHTFINIHVHVHVHTFLHIVVTRTLSAVSRKEPLSSSSSVSSIDSLTDKIMKAMINENELVNQTLAISPSKTVPTRNVISTSPTGSGFSSGNGEEKRVEKELIDDVSITSTIHSSCDKLNSKDSDPFQPNDSIPFQQKDSSDSFPFQPNDSIPFQQKDSSDSFPIQSNTTEQAISMLNDNLHNITKQ